MAEQKQLLIKENVADPETMKTYYAGEVVSVGGEDGISEEQHARLVGRHGDKVEDLSEIESKSKEELAEVARAVGVDDSGTKEEVAKRVAKAK